MSDIAIQVENLSKLYRIGARQEKYRTLRDTIADAAASPFRRVRSAFGGSALSGRGTDTIWALKDVSFEVKRGEVVGIIGRNGAGKSTLLKILSRITEPTSGYAKIHGRVGSLLEVGTGFHPELTGRENIYLNGAILGMKRAEIERKFDEIVAFSEIEKFIDTPVKFYSSGMYLRLAFAVAAHLEPEVLLVDEVLAVGDAEFQRKCLGKIGDVAREGRTILFVSHNMGAIRKLCTECILLGEGRTEMFGDSETVIRKYLTANTTYHGAWKRSSDMPQGRGIFFEEVTIRSHRGAVTGHFDSSEPLSINVSVYVPEEINDAQIAIQITNQESVPVFTTANTNSSKAYPTIQAGRHKYVIDIPGSFLHPGLYSIIIASMIPRAQIYDLIEDELSFLIEDMGNHATALRDGRLGVVTPIFEWKEA